tara:strand:- start:677 stop:1663 length:987 start_codon:yes stop_codon:yes gene_type:complete
MTAINKDNHKGSIKVDRGNIRLDVFLQSHFEHISRTRIKNCITDNKVLINNVPVKPSYLLKGNEIIDYNFCISNTSDKLKSQKINLDIIYEDDYLIVINKSSGLIVHPGNGVSDGTLVNGLVFHFSRLSSLNSSRPGIIHRLDKETSGVILIAKDNETHFKLSKQFEDRTIKKTYRSIVWGNVTESGLIKGFIDRDRRNRTTFILNYHEKGRHSESAFKKIDYFAPLSYIEVYPKTGRTHQIRVHLKSIGHSIICDNSYGGGNEKIKSYHMKYRGLLKLIFKSINRVALHAYSIEIIHPKSLKKMKFTAPIPNDFENILNILKDYNND